MVGEEEKGAEPQKRCLGVLMCVYAYICVCKARFSVSDEEAGKREARTQRGEERQYTGETRARAHTHTHTDTHTHIHTDTQTHRHTHTPGASGDPLWPSSPFSVSRAMAATRAKPALILPRSPLHSPLGRGRAGTAETQRRKRERRLCTQLRK